MTGTHAAEVIKKIDTDPEKALTVTQQDRYLSVVERLAADPNVDIEKLQKIIDMKNREEDRSAEQAFNADMVAAQSEIKVAVKNKKNEQTRSEYADLSSLIISAKPIYTKYGFALSFYPGESPEGYIRVTVDIMHRDGHSKTRHYDSPIDLTGIAGKVNKTKIHAEASSFTYGRRYLTASTFNIPTADDDGNSATPVEYVTGKDLNIIRKLVKETESDTDAFWKFAKSQDINTIPTSEFNRVLAALNQKKANLQKGRETGSDDE